MGSRRGFGMGEVIVLVLIVAVVGLLLLSALPRRREAARMVVCRQNLGRIGEALGRFEAAQNRLPSVPALGPDEPPTMSGPLAEMIQVLGVSSLANPDGPARPKAQGSGLPSEPWRIPGFLCPADRQHGDATRFPAPVNYRATTGSGADGSGGAFAPGGPAVRMAEIEAADGLAYTVAFAERLLGSTPGGPAMSNYAVVPSPIGAEGCPTAPANAWQDDAGASWAEASWASTLYNHALTPNGQPSCIAEDRRTARMGASSHHQEGVNILKFDMSVATITSRVDPKVWRALANLDDSRGEDPEPPPPPSTDSDRLASRDAGAP